MQEMINRGRPPASSRAGERVTFSLELNELRELGRLPPLPDVAFAFWGRVAYARGLDYRTILFDDAEYSALPDGHRRHWCFPAPLKCKTPVPAEVA
jgi:hypothetical protein